MDELKIKHKGGNNMDRQQAKELLPIIQAFAEGKIIQSRRINGMWVDLGMKTALNIISLINEPQKYRLKPEPQYRPFKDAEECWQEMLRHEPFGWVKTDEGYEQIWHVNKGDDFNATLKTSTFADGTPFGINEEE